jgi:hypothetical protein
MYKGGCLVANIAEYFLAACAFEWTQFDYPLELDLHLPESALSCRFITEEHRMDHPAVNSAFDRKRPSHASPFKGNARFIIVFFIP